MTSEAPYENEWTTARRVVSDDHPTDCPCVRDHLEVSFIHGLRYGAENAQQPDDALRVAALRSALERVVASYLDVTVSDSSRPFQMYRIAKNALETDAPADAPFEPSEEMVERAVEAMRQVPVWDGGELMPDAWPNLARAALRAAFSPPPAGPPASA